MTISTEPTIQIRSDKTWVRSHPLRDGIHDKSLDLEAIQTGGNHSPDDWDRAPRSSSQQGNRRSWGGYQLLYDAPGNQEMMTKTTAETTSHRTAGELPSCLQCRHGRHSGTTPYYAAMWPQGHDDSHARMYSTRWRSLQAKSARPSLRLTTLRSGEPIALYALWPRTLYKNS